MSLNDIQLKDFIVAEWYKDALLESPDGPPALLRPSGPGPAAPASGSPSAGPVTEKQVPIPQPTATTPAVPPSAPIPAAANAQPPTQTPIPQSAPTKPAANTAAAPAANTPASNPPVYKFLGKNSRRISILVEAPNDAFLPDDQLNFLSKILEACRMNVGDVAIINHAVTPVNITALKQQLHPSVILLFGIDPTHIKLPISFPDFKIQPYDECTYLLSPSLEKMVHPNEEAKLLKSKLWVSLKTLFQV